MSIQKTPNYGLNKPGYDEFADIAELNENADIIDDALKALEEGKADHVPGMGFSEANFSVSEKNKLAGIETGAQANRVNSVNGKIGPVVLGASDVGARPDTWSPTPEEIGASPTGHTHPDKYDKPLRFASVSVPSSAWVTDATYADYGYKADIALTGVTSSMIPDVVLPLIVATGGEVAPIAFTGSGYVRLYASAVQAAMTIPTITLWKAV